VRSGALVALPITRRGIHRQWSAAVLARKDPPAYLDRFVELLTQIAKPPEAGAGLRISAVAD
jgi:hypothetical protein